jgi:lysophospholipid acyltransferase (LPLAT)-like uncharacterized protein
MQILRKGEKMTNEEEKICKENEAKLLNVAEAVSTAERKLWDRMRINCHYIEIKCLYDNPHKCQKNKRECTFDTCPLRKGE